MSYTCEMAGYFYIYQVYIHTCRHTHTYMRSNTLQTSLEEVSDMSYTCETAGYFYIYQVYIHTCRHTHTHI